MGEDRGLAALDRIERAIARVEAAAERGPPPSASSPDGDARLREAHEALKGKVELAIAQIDRLLATAETP
ncbi:MAG TPA: hypothetical protein VGD66_09890 [Allosphingosinicella sp.]|jgi:hypothetical protein